MSLVGLSSRASVWAFVVVSILAAIAGLAYGFWDHRYFACVIFFGAAWMYWRTIQWVDRHGQWP